ncbi:MAG: RidA family protein [Pseudomonadota bacterium]
MLETRALPAPKFRYAPAVEAGPFIRTAGLVGLDPAAGELVPGGAAAEFEQIMTMLFGLMEDNALSLKDLVSATLYVTDFDDFPKINAVWERFVPAGGPLPARTAVGVSALPLGAAVEAEFMLMKDQN